MIEMFVEEKKILDIQILVQPIILHYASDELTNIILNNTRDKLYAFDDDDEEITQFSGSMYLTFEFRNHNIRIPMGDIFTPEVKEKFNQPYIIHHIRETSRYDYSDRKKYFVRASICIIPNHMREDITTEELYDILLDQKYDTQVSMLPQETDPNALNDQETLQKIRDVLKSADERRMHHG